MNVSVSIFHKIFLLPCIYHGIHWNFSSDIVVIHPITAMI
uniref:Uncharacterized protein n=1 Tax=Anguilla anguilla TaxID=7936 RepID=A0A0E9R0E6_ANGAN